MANLLMHMFSHSHAMQMTHWLHMATNKELYPVDVVLLKIQTIMQVTNAFPHLNLNFDAYITFKGK